MPKVTGTGATTSTFNIGYDYGVWGDSGIGVGVVGTSDGASGVQGISTDGAGIGGSSTNGAGVVGSGGTNGVEGRSQNPNGYGVYGESPNNGVTGRGTGSGSGVYAFNDSSSNTAYLATTDYSGDFRGNVSVSGYVTISGDTLCESDLFVLGPNTYCTTLGCSNGIVSGSDSHDGVQGISAHNTGVRGINENTNGRLGYTPGVFGYAHVEDGVWAISEQGSGIFASGGNYAAWLNGNVNVTGQLSKSGGGFTIDHPLDHANKYLRHSFVESSDMKNIYDGVAVLNAKGEAVIKLPSWFEAVNKDFRYQLTSIGAPGPNLYIAEEIKKNSFKIAGGKPRSKVSWQITGIRKDPWANANRIQVEGKKPAEERGYYLHPELYGKPAKKGIVEKLFPKRTQPRKLLEKHKQQMKEHEQKIKELREKAPVR